MGSFARNLLGLLVGFWRCCCSLVWLKAKVIICQVLFIDYSRTCFFSSRYLVISRQCYLLPPGAFPQSRLSSDRWCCRETWPVAAQAPAQVHRISNWARAGYFGGLGIHETKHSSYSSNAHLMFLSENCWLAAWLSICRFLHWPVFYWFDCPR